MVDSNICGRWVCGDIELFAGDPVAYRGIRWRVTTARQGSIRDGFAPIIPEDEECASVVGAIGVNIQKLARVHEVPISATK